jgi:hypothetical protein
VAGTLRDDLLAIPGIEGAELEGDDTSPVGVRVRLSTGADADSVSQRVREVLAVHGMRSQVSSPRVEPAAPPPPPGAPAAVIDLHAAAGGGEDEQPPPERPEDAAAPAAAVPVSRAVAAPPTTATAEPPRFELDSVAVEEGRSGVTVRITATTGTVVSRVAAPLPGGVDESIVAAVAEITGHRTTRLLGVQESDLGGTPVLTVAVELADRSRAVGSAVSEGGRAYAVARAAWAALTP